MANVNDTVTAAAATETKRLVLYTDGACRNNGYAGATAAAAVYFGDGDGRNTVSAVTGLQTNNRAELQGITLALEATKQHPHVEICTDSVYCIRGCTRQNNSLLNLDLLTPIWQELDRRQALQHIVTWTHVRGHGKCAGNNAADKLATQHADQLARATTATDTADAADAADTAHATSPAAVPTCPKRARK